MYGAVPNRASAAALKSALPCHDEAVSRTSASSVSCVGTDVRAAGRDLLGQSHPAGYHLAPLRGGFSGLRAMAGRTAATELALVEGIRHALPDTRFATDCNPRDLTMQVAWDTLENCGRNSVHAGFRTH